MLKKIMVTSPILILFLFSISFLPLTQITEAEAQFPNKIQKQLSNKIPKQRSLSKAIKKPTPGKLTDKEKMMSLRKRMEWSFDTPMEKLILKINYGIWNEVEAYGRFVDDLALLNGRMSVPRRDGGTLSIEHVLRPNLQRNLGCEAPNRNVNNTNVNYTPLCGSLESYREMSRSNTLVIPFYAGYVTHNQLLFCGIDLPDIVTVAQDQRVAIRSVVDERRRAMQQSPISIKLRSHGIELGKCFCKFGSRRGTHPSQGYENIVPVGYSNVCPL
jgi:hypothetical protein